MRAPLFLFRSFGSTSKIIEADVRVINAQRVEQVEDGLGHHRRTSSEAVIHDFVTCVTRVMVTLPPLSIANSLKAWFTLDT